MTMIEVRKGNEWIIRLVDGEALVDTLRRLDCDSALILMGIGMLRDVKVGYWNGEDYEVHAYPDPAELLSLQGNLSMDDNGQRIAHAHLSLSLREGTVRGGHLVAATVHNTLEMALRPLEGIALKRRLEANGLVGLFPSKKI